MRIGIKAKIFICMNELKNFLLSNNIISTTVICNNCRELYALKRLIACSSAILYRCPKRRFQKRHYLFLFRIPLADVVHLIYLLMLDLSYSQINYFQFVSDSTIARYKALFLDAYWVYIQQRPVLLGGPGIIVKVDKSVLSRRGVVCCTTTSDDTILNTFWILSGIDRTPQRNFFLARVEKKLYQPYRSYA